MEIIENLFFPIFNTFLGGFMVLTALEIIKPIKDKEQLEKQKTIFLIIGILLFLFGIFKLL